MTSTPSDIKNLGTILCVGAHPDDETYIAGGLISMAAKNGQAVVCITATHGEQGVQDEKRWPQHKLAQIRADEHAKAMKILGVKHNLYLNLPDGGCIEADVQEQVSEIKKVINKYKVNTVVTFGPDGLTGHNDHKAVSGWASQATNGSRVNVLHFAMPALAHTLFLAACAKTEIEYNDFFFNIGRAKTAQESECEVILSLDDDQWQTKLMALKAMPSQTENLINGMGKYYQYVFSQEAFIKA